MSKDKRKKIWNEIKITYAKIREIHSAPQITSTDQYLSLTPIANADEDNAYSDMLKFALSQDKINNIAITGPYGSGKSSVLLTFQTQNPNWKYLNISLATFKDHLEIEGTNNKEIEIEAIEKSILQQLFYSVDQKTLPRSRLKRIVTVKPRELLANTLFIMFWIFLTLFVFFPGSIFFDKFSILASSEQFAQITFSLLFLSYCIVGLFTGIKYIEKLKELKLKFQDTEITLNNDKTESILNKHLDEILYFFERTDFNIIIIEDLDRFENSEIFIRLRELNTLINNSKQVNRPIVFLYAIRDNMFKDKDRSKFFDFIIPIIPVINPTNAYDLIRKNYINKENDSQLHKEIEDIFLHQVSLYFDDMRLVTNIFNEFKLYVNKLNNLNLNKNKLLALIIYKNHYPAEFANLHSNKGEIYELFKIRKKKIISNHLEEIEQEIKKLEEKIQASELENIQYIIELRKLYIYEILKRFPQITSISNRHYSISNASYLIKLKIDDLYLDYNNLILDENFEIIKNAKNIQWVVDPQNNIQYTNIKIENDQEITFTFKNIEKIVHDTLSYNERETKIKNKEVKNHEKILEKRQNLVNKRNLLKQNTLKELLTIYSSEEFFESDMHPPLLQFLVREGYIDEHYPDYISFFIDSVINITERDYAQRVINHINSDFDITLTNVKKILEKYLTPRQFLHTSILNFSLVDFILENHDKFNDHYNNLFKLLSNQDEHTIQFIFEYIDREKNSPLFINKIVKIWQYFFEHIHTSMANEKIESYLLLILKNLEKENISLLNKDNILKKYLSSKSNFIEYIKDAYSTEQEILNFLQLIKPVFKYLDCNNQNDVSIFNKICRNEYFEFNEKMILQIICINNEVQKIDEIQNIFASKPYGVLQDFAPDYLKTQVDQSISHFFEEVYISSSENLSENSDNFIKLINNEDLDNSHKEWLIENNEVQIDLISYICKAQFWKPILAKNKVKPSWDSLISYYKYNDSTLDEVIFNYIDKNNELLKEQEISDSESKKSIPEVTNEFEIALLESNSFSKIAYQAIVCARMFNYKSLDLSNLSDSKISLLISEKVLSLTSENTESLRKKSSSYIRDIIVRNSGDFLELIEEIILENHEYELLLQSSELTHEQKLIIVKKLGINFYQESNVQYTINQIFKDNGKYIPIEYINNYFEKTLSTQTRVKFLIPEISNLAHSDISTLLNMLDEPYRSITNVGNHSLSHSDENENLINALKEIAYINRVRIHEKSFLGIKSKSKITFTTK
ncbi:YobI family P-loop NTPase [Acinetobacter amyesii]|uniref:YobI family P-loop NTPase n=1 Tax=Acinetobacter amyesii TaxID=2942470 RepID=UPI003F053B83